jgi:integrase
LAIITETSATSSIAYRNFIHSLKSPKTRADYLRSLGYYMSFLKVKLQEERNDSYEKLLQQDPKIIASDIIDFIIHLKDQKKVSPATVNSYVAAIRHFYDMNEVDLKWKKINSFKGEFYNVVEDRPYSREEIKLMVDHADIRNSSIILLMASSGMRVGAIPELKVKDLLPIDKYGIYQITVYKKSRSKYISFCTIIGKFTDILMLALTHKGRIRTEKEFHKLLNSSGFDITNIIRSPDPAYFLSIMEAIQSS